jgi:hypothetical protein
MRAFTLPFFVLVSLGLLGRTALARPPEANGHYCNLSVFTTAELERLKTLADKAARDVSARKDLDNGYAFQFSGELKEIGEWIDEVRRCCPTLRYEVTYEAHQGPVEIKVTGDDGARTFIHEEFRRLFEKKL